MRLTTENSQSVSRLSGQRVKRGGMDNNISIFYIVENGIENCNIPEFICN